MIGRWARKSSLGKSNELQTTIQDIEQIWYQKRLIVI